MKLLLLGGALVPRKGDCGKPRCRLRGTSQTHTWRPFHSQLTPPGKPARILLCPTSSLGCSGPHSRSPSGSEGEAGSLTCMNSCALPTPPHLLPPGPQQTVVNSPRGPGLQVQEEGWGASPNTLARPIFIQMFFAINWGEWQSQECAGFLMTRPGKCVRAAAQMGTWHFLPC